MLCWGMYGTALHTGAVKLKGPDGDPNEARMKAFLLVGLAYFVFAVIIPIIILMAKGASFKMTPGGFGWGSYAGFLGALGALGVILAFGNGGHPVVVMSLIFAGAPLVNAIYASVFVHPPDDGWRAIKPQFVLGIALAALGGFLVTKYKPEGGHKPGQHAKAPAAASADPAEDKS